ncbi:MAG: biotin--[acetyl-CoA-carboxylase] ligase, partial [Planctomycetota bacterium]
MTVSRPHELDATTLSRDLNTSRVGRRITVLRQIDSTNDYALDTLAAREAKAADGHVVFAEHQTAGHGRLGRAWLSPRGASLLFTLLLWEDAPVLTPERIVMAAALGVAAGIENATDVEPVVRWPNDVDTRGRKLAGILVEVRPGCDRARAIAIGIGVNCLQQPGHFPPEIRETATSLEIESAAPV